MSKSDEFVFINSRTSGADTQQSVNQTCIKLQGSEPVPDPVFWRVNNNQGEKRASTLFLLFLKIGSAVQYIRAFRAAQLASHIASLHCPSELSLGCASADEVVFPSPSPFGPGEENENISVPVPTLSCNSRPELPTGVCAHTHSHQETKQGKYSGWRAHCSASSGEPSFANSPFLRRE